MTDHRVDDPQAPSALPARANPPNTGEATLPGTSDITGNAWQFDVIDKTPGAPAVVATRQAGTTAHTLRGPTTVSVKVGVFPREFGDRPSG